MDAYFFPILLGGHARAGKKTVTDELFRHLEPMYTFAQVLTLDVDKAIRLVEETYRAALDAAGKEEGSESVDRPWLYQKMRELFASSDIPAPSGGIDGTATEGEKPRLFTQQYNIKQRLVDPFLKHAAPVAFASLGERDRTLLALCEAESLSCNDAARVLQEPGEIVCRQLVTARNAFHMTIMAQASPMLRDLLGTLDPDEWVPATLRRAVKAEFGSLPPTLEPAIRSAMAEPPPSHVASGGSKMSTYEDRATRFRINFARSLVTVSLIVAAGLLGYIGSAALNRPVDPNVIGLAVRKADGVTLSLMTASPDEAAGHIKERLSWRLDVPTIHDATLLGAGVTEMANQVYVPTFLYADGDANSDRRIVLFAFNYALLDRNPERLFLERSIMSAIADDTHFDLYDLSDDNKIVIWRRADDIYLAVTQGDPAALKDRIQF